MSNQTKLLRIVSRKQWRFLSLVATRDNDKELQHLSYDRDFLMAVLNETDYDSLPEKAGDPTAKPMPKAEEMRPCACDECGLTFSVVGQYRKYHPECPTRNQPKTRQPKASRYRPHVHYDGQWEIWTIEKHCRADHAEDFATVRILVNGGYRAPRNHDSLLVRKAKPTAEEEVMNTSPQPLPLPQIQVGIIKFFPYTQLKKRGR